MRSSAITSGGEGAAEIDDEQGADDRSRRCRGCRPTRGAARRHVDSGGGQAEADAQRQQHRDDESDDERRGQRLAPRQLGIDRRRRRRALPGSIEPTVNMKADDQHEGHAGDLEQVGEIGRFARATSRGPAGDRCGRGPSSTSRCQATMNITVGITSTAFSTSTAISESIGRPAADDADGERQDPGDGDEVEEQAGGWRRRSRSSPTAPR